MSKSIMAVKANPKILKWARNKVGLSSSEAARCINIKEAKLTAVEQGEEFLTVGQLRKLAEKYKRPLALFFSEKIPEDIQIPDFRVRKTTLDAKIEGKINIIIREMLELKKNAEILYEELNLSYDYSFIGQYSTFEHASEKQVAEFIIKKLNLNHNDLRGQQDSEVLNHWKSLIEKLGILVFQFQEIPPEYLRGFVFGKTPFPLIAINQKDSYYARVFTLIHELCHILIGTDTICDVNLESEQQVDEKGIEVFCNRVVENVLFPDTLLNNEQTKQIIENSLNDIDIVKNISQKYKISESVALYKLYHESKITYPSFSEIIQSFSTRSFQTK